MAASIYQELQDLADSLLRSESDQLGQSTDVSPISITYRTPVSGSSELDEPTFDETTVRAEGISRGVSEKRDGMEMLSRADKVVIIKAKGVAIPDSEDLVNIGPETFSVFSVEPIPGGETPAILKIMVKR